MEERRAKKASQRLSLGVSGTTKEKAAEAGYISSLADLALSVAEDSDTSEKEE